MKLTVASPRFLWQSCAQPSAAWFLVWMPLSLLLLDGNASATSAMARLLAVLMVSALIWARGLGPGGALADRVFVAFWAGAWAAALGTLVTAGGWSSSMAGLASLFGTLLVGAGWLGWAYHERQELQSDRCGEESGVFSHDKPYSLGTIALTWLLAALVFVLALSTFDAHWSDGVVLVSSMICFTVFQRGRVSSADKEAD